jgi:hypothetical protein
MCYRVALVNTDVSEKSISSIIRVERILELGTTLAITSNQSRLRRKIRPDDGRDTFFRNVCSNTSYITSRPKKDNLHSHLRGNFKSYKALTGWAL